MMDDWYRGQDNRDHEIFAALPDPTWYAPPDEFTHGKWAEVARVPKTDGSDGQPCVIYECRMPARFYKVEALESRNSVDAPVPGFALSTGSGDAMGKLCVSIALAASQGMIGLDKESA